MEVGEIKLLFNGKDRALKPAMTAQGIGNTVLTTVLLRWKSQQLIDDFGKPGELDRDADYTLKISGTQDEEGSLPGIIPYRLHALLVSFVVDAES